MKLIIVKPKRAEADEGGRSPDEKTIPYGRCGERMDLSRKVNRRVYTCRGCGLVCAA